MKNAEGVVGTGITPPIAGETTVEVPIESTRAPEAPKRSNTTRSKYGFGRLSTDQSRPKKTRESVDGSRATSSKGSSTAAEDSARRARKNERSKKAQDDDQKPSGLKGVFKRWFG